MGVPTLGACVFILSQRSNLIFASTLPYPGLLRNRQFQEHAKAGAEDEDGEGGGWRHGGLSEARWLESREEGRRGRLCALPGFTFSWASLAAGVGHCHLQHLDRQGGKGGGLASGTTEGEGGQDGPHEWSGRRGAPVEALPWCTPHHHPEWQKPTK